jgi:hypothetical protein
MGEEDDILALIDLIYETAFNSALWPAALIRLADITGTAQVGLASMDSRAQTYESIAPRTDPNNIGPSRTRFGPSAQRNPRVRYTYSIT